MFIKHNVNPKGKKTGDCSIRAVVVATGLTWDQAYIGLAEAGLKLKTCMNDTEAIGYFLKSLGFTEGKIRIHKGERRITVEQFSEMYPNYYAVLRTAGHITVCGRGNYVDIWDCGSQAVYKYWYKEMQG